MIASREYVKDLITKVLKSVGFKKENNKYSTDEIIVGQWIDGKPIYRKVFVTTTPSSYTANTTLSEVIDSNMDYLCRLDYTMVTTGNNYKYTGSANSYGNTGIAAVWVTDDNHLRIRLNDSTYKNCPLTIIVEYTKTTD